MLHALLELGEAIVVLLAFKGSSVLYYSVCTLIFCFDCQLMISEMQGTLYQQQTH